MHFTALHLENFRNYESLDMELPAGITCITGPNGSGKTNLLEAIHYLALTRGFIAQSEKYALKHDERFFFVHGKWMEAGTAHLVKCNYLKGRGKAFLVDEEPVRRLADHIGRIPVITVLPGDSGLISGAPADRRKLMDAFISQYDHGYLEHLISYEKVLSQRNALLKHFDEHDYFSEDELAVWDERLIVEGMPILDARRAFLKQFSPVFCEKYQAIVSGDEKPEIVLETRVPENTREGWMDMLLKSRKRDRVLGSTRAGIHKDDLEFIINGAAAKNFGSQGQQKTFAISLKLAQYQLLSEYKQTAPLLLLDDIFDKLDRNRLNRLSGVLHDEVKGQVLITDTSPDRSMEVFGKDGRLAGLIKVTPGKAERIQ